MAIKRKCKLTQDILKEYLSYDENTGLFTCIKKRCQRDIVGGGVGTPDKDGYVVITMGSSRYKAHRLAILYTDGYMPEHQVDHINRITNDNRRINLREVSQQCNSRNTSVRSDNTTGVTGTTRDSKTGKWVAQIFVSGSKEYLGSFEEHSDAVKARWDAEVKHDYANCCTTSSAYQYLKGNNLI